VEVGWLEYELLFIFLYYNTFILYILHKDNGEGVKALQIRAEGPGLWWCQRGDAGVEHMFSVLKEEEGGG